MLQILRHNKDNRKAINEMQSLVAQDDFKIAMNAISSRYTDLLKSITNPYMAIESSILRTAISRTMNLFKKHQGWEYFFAYWLVHKKIPKDFNPSLPTLEIEHAEPVNNRRYNKYGELIYHESSYNLRIYPTTTKRDIDNVFGQIKSIISPKSTRVKSKPNLDRDNRIYTLHKESYKPKEIAKIINQEYTKTFLGAVEITTIINRMRKSGINKH